MKTIKNSFLFFCAALTNLMCVFSLASQTSKDSISFYYKSITKITDVETTTKAFDFFEKKTVQALLENDTIKAAYYSELITLGQFKMGFLYESESTAIKTLSLLDAVKNNPKTIAPRRRLLNQLGMLYRKLDDYDNSNRFYSEALALNDNDLTTQLAITNNIANNFADQGFFKKATTELDKYYNKVIDLKNSNIKATYLDNIGYYQSKINHPDGIKNMRNALKIRLSLKDLTGLFSSYRHLSLYYLDKGHKEKALKYSQKAKAISDTLNSPIFQREALTLGLRLETNPNFEKYITLNNSIEKENLSRENKFAAIKYNINEKEKIINENKLKIKAGELQKEKQKKLKLIYLFSGLFVLTASIFLLLFFRLKHKKEKIKQVHDTEKRISKKVHDEVANDLYQVMTKLQFKNRANTDVLDNLEDIYNKTRDISKENSPIDVAANYGELLQDLLLSYKTNSITIIARNISKINWNAISEIKKTTLYRVLQELMTNMRKHSNATMVALLFHQDKNNVVLEYKDNGQGCNLKKNTGLRNAENRIASINGTITFESQPNKGFKVKIKI